MASTDFSFNVPTKETLELAREEGFKIETLQSGGNRLKIRVTHPLLVEGITLETATHGEVNGNLVKYLARSTKQLRRLQRDTEVAVAENAAIPEYVVPTFNYGQGEAPHIPVVAVRPYSSSTFEPAAVEPEPAPPVEPVKPAPSFEEMVSQASDTLIVWLDEQQRGGLIQFTKTSINNKVRDRLGLPGGPKGAEAVDAALDKLVKLRILSAGTLPSDSGRKLSAYRLNQFNGTTIYDAYEGRVKLAAPPQPSPDVPLKIEPEDESDAIGDEMEAEQVPEPVPQPLPPPAMGTTGLIASLFKAAATNDELMRHIIDGMITKEQYDVLAQIIVDSGDTAEAEKILRRVAELSCKE